MEEKVEEKQLTLKSLEKKINEKMVILDTKISLLERNMEIIKKTIRGK